MPVVGQAASPSTGRPAVRSLVVLNPLGILMAGPLLLGVALLVIAFLQAALNHSLRAGLPAGLTSLNLLALAGWAAWHSNRPRLLTLTRDHLLLEPWGSSIAHGVAAETIPLTQVTAYKHWLRLLRYRYVAQYHLRLELAGGRVIRLADQPAPPPDDSPGFVRLDIVTQRLARWVPRSTRVRPLFYLTRVARILLWLSWAMLAAAAVLLWLGHPAGSLLLFPGAGYWASYYLGRGVAEITAPNTVQKK